MTCANCKTEALYEYKITLTSSVFYCGKHLPKFLEARKKAYLITVTKSLVTQNQEAVNTLAPVEESEPVVEPSDEEKQEPKKKAPKKKAE